MADIKTVGAGPRGDCDGEGEGGERGERGHRGHRGHRGPTGPTGPAAAAGPPFWPPFPAVVPTITTIFVRATGSDSAGNGTAGNPYRTFQRAIRDVPHAIPPGNQYNIDVTGIGVEVFPANYALPEIHGPALITSAGDPSTLPFLLSTSLNIRATPQPATNIPVADTSVPLGYVVTADPNTGLAIITVAPPRASWAGDALKGKLLVGDASAGTSSAIYGSSPTQLFVANLPGAIAGNLTVSEPSATFQTPSGDVDGAGFESADVTSIAFQGIAFTCLDGSLALGIMRTPQPVIELCDLGGLFTEVCSEQIFLSSSVIRNGLDIEASNITPTRCLFLDLASFFFGESNCLVRRSVFDGTMASIGPSAVFIGFGATGGTWEFGNTLIKGSVAPDGAVSAQGWGSYAFDTVQIQGASADAIHGEGLVSLVLNAVVGGTGGPGDPANGGVGISLIDGATARVVDDGTLVTGAGGDMKVGTLAPRTWADFRTIAPIKNEYDLSTPFVTASSGVSQPPGDELTGAGTGGRSGSRLFQRP